MSNLSRRAFALGLPATAAAFYGLSSGPAVAQTGATSGQAGQPHTLPPAAQFKIGRFTVAALADGQADLPFGYFPVRSAQQVEEMVNAIVAAKPGGVRMMFNQSLVDDDEPLILSDAG